MKKSRSTPRKRKTPATTPLLVVGLGNPVDEYGGTRHNAGADAVRLLAKRHNIPLEQKPKLFAETAEGRIERAKTVLAFPTVYMNQSGKSVAALSRFFHIKPERIVIAHDDMDLPLGSLKITFGRGSGGHKGVESVFRAIKTKEIGRLRIGTMGSGRSQKPGQRELEDIVVKHMTPAELDTLKKGVRKASDALQTIVTEGLERAMNEWNQ